MNILLLEDKAARLYELQKVLENHGYRIYLCSDVYEAKSTFKKYEENIDYLIIDLAMDPEGLIKEEYIKASEKGYFTGWIWVKEYVIKKDRKFIEKTIIFSAFADMLEELKQNEMTNEFKNICIISKNDADWKIKIFNKLGNIQNQNGEKPNSN